MSCSGCEQNVENALNAVGGVRRVEADHGGGTVDLAAAIHDAGYDPV